jgi:hypothetical protein
MSLNTAMRQRPSGTDRQPCSIRRSNIFLTNMAEAKLPPTIANQLLARKNFFCKACTRVEKICDVSVREWIEGDYWLSTIPWYVVCYYDAKIVYPLYIKEGRKIFSKRTNDALQAVKLELGLP